MKILIHPSSIFPKLICLLFLFSIPLATQSQSLELYNVKSNKTKSIVSTNNVTIFTRNPKMDKIKGKLELLNDTTILINNFPIPINDITAINVITPTSQMLGYIFAGVSALYLTIGIITLSNVSSAGFFGGILAEVFGTTSVVVGIGAAIPAIRYLFFGKTYRKNAGWVLQVPGP
ncbi:MAG: hypothetical protein IPI60_00560 [Saprospiraceae bacterium]|nr:hypothetical protein [Saprospiraceae bacterium]